MKLHIACLFPLIAACNLPPPGPPPVPLTDLWTSQQLPLTDARVVSSTDTELVVAYAKPADDHSPDHVMELGMALEARGMLRFDGRRPFEHDNSVGWVHEAYDPSTHDFYRITKQNTDDAEQIRLVRSTMPVVTISRHKKSDEDSVTLAANCITADVAKLHAALKEIFPANKVAEKKTNILCFSMAAGLVKNTTLDDPYRNKELFGTYGEAFTGAANRFCFGGTHGKKYSKCTFDDQPVTPTLYDASVKEE